MRSKKHLVLASVSGLFKAKSQFVNVCNEWAIMPIKYAARRRSVATCVLNGWTSKKDARKGSPRKMHSRLARVTKVIWGAVIVRNVSYIMWWKFGNHAANTFTIRTKQRNSIKENEIRRTNTTITLQKTYYVRPRDEHIFPEDPVRSIYQKIKQQSPQ